MYQKLLIFGCYNLNPGLISEVTILAKGIAVSNLFGLSREKVTIAAQ